MYKSAIARLNQGYRPLRTSADLSGDAISVIRVNPPLDLMPYVMEFWEYRVNPAYPYVPVQVIPNGCLSIRFNIKANSVEPVLYGPSVLNSMKGVFYQDWTIFGAALWPSHSYQLLGLSLEEIRDLRINLDCIWPNETALLCEQIQSAIDMNARINCLSGFLRKHLSSQAPPRTSFLNALEKLVEQPTYNQDISCIATETGISTRSLRRYFHKYLGIGPKQMQELIKVQRGIAAIARSANLNLSDLSINLGYSDQPHFSHKFRNFVGLTPGQFASLIGTMHYKQPEIWEGVNAARKHQTPPRVFRFK